MKLATLPGVNTMYSFAIVSLSFGGYTHQEQKHCSSPDHFAYPSNLAVVCSALAFVALLFSSPSVEGPAPELMERAIKILHTAMLSQPCPCAS